MQWLLVTKACYLITFNIGLTRYLSFGAIKCQSFSNRGRGGFYFVHYYTRVFVFVCLSLYLYFLCHSKNSLAVTPK